VATPPVSTAVLSVRLSAAAGLLARKKALMAAPMPATERSTVAATPVVTYFDRLDCAGSTVIYYPSIMSFISESGIFSTLRWRAKQKIGWTFVGHLVSA